MAADGQAVIKRYDKLNGEGGNHRARCQRMAPYIAPSRVGSLELGAPGQPQNVGVYDSTTMQAAELMAMFIAGHIINPSQRWFDYEMENSEDNKVDSIREWNEECRDVTLKYAGSSMFYAEGPESLIDYGGFGTGFLLCEEAPQPTNLTMKGFRGFYFNAEKTGSFLIQDGANGLVDTAFRRFELTARVAADRWGKENLSEKIQNTLTSGRQDEPFKFVHAVYPRPKSEQYSMGNKGMPWASCWVEYETKHVILETGYRKFPAAVPRYQRTPGEAMGRGRGDLAFPDTWTLNSAKRMGLEDWALKIRPPIMHSHSSVIGTLRIIPGAATPINTQGRPIRESIMPWETGSHPEVSNIKEEELRKTIKSIFYVDQILALLEVQKSEMTAFEFAKKIELLFRILGPVYGRMEWEYLHRIVDIMWDLLYYGGAFPPPPPEIQQTNGRIGVQFHNPIAKAQRSGDAEALTMALNDLGPLVQVFPQVFDRLDPQETADGIYDLRGVPAKWLRSDDQLKAFQDEKQKQHEQELAMQQAQGIANAAGKAAPMAKVLADNKGGSTTPNPMTATPAGTAA